MSWISPFSLSGKWFKGNVHTHTTQSDGLLTPEQAIAWYRKRGYDFIAITDHWVLTPGKALGGDFITITGTELNGSDYHMLALGLDALPDREIADATQLVNDAVLAAGGFSFFAHPYWMGQTSADIAAIEGITGLEVFNSVCEKMDGLGYAQVQWDELLAKGLRFTGLAVDDVHWKHGAEGGGFIMVRCEDLDETNVLDAIRKGHFYSSTGPKIMDLRLVHLVDGKLGLRVHCSPCRRITFYTADNGGHRFQAPQGEMLDTAIYPFNEEKVYMRVECVDALGGVAWGNPVFVEDVLSEG